MKQIIIRIGNKLERRRRKNNLDIIRGCNCSCGYEYNSRCAPSSRSRVIACGYTEEDLIGCGSYPRSRHYSSSSCGYSSSSRC
jgi:hypothetical protein